MKTLISTNPGKNYQNIGEVRISTLKEIKNKVAKANSAKLMWKELGVRRRTEIIRPVLEEFTERRKEIIGSLFRST